MKSRFLLTSILLCALVITSFAQTDSPTYTDIYTGVSISVPNTNVNDFQSNSYAFFELGAMRDNVALGAIVGVSSLNSDQLWVEIKSSYYFPIGVLDGYGLIGVGKYLSNDNMFIEYGAGVAYAKGRLTYSLQVSNWDSNTYISPGIAFTW